MAAPRARFVVLFVFGLLSAALACAQRGPAPPALEIEAPAEAGVERDVARAEAPEAPLPSAESEATEADLEEALLEEELLAEARQQAVPDPLEPWNRGVLYLNRGLDTVLIDPVTRAYGFLVPDAAKRSVRRFFDNLGTPPVLVNDLLQLEGRRAAVTSGRFLLNSTVGLAGLFDPARRMGLRGHHADFGQTLWHYGVGSGAYLVLPIFGPSSARDAVGRLVDGALRVDTWLLGGAEIFLLGVGDGLSLREMHHEALEELERSSIDYYAALRSVYWMNRQHVLEGRRDATTDLDAAEEEVLEESAPESDSG